MRHYRHQLAQDDFDTDTGELRVSCVASILSLHTANNSTKIKREAEDEAHWNFLPHKVHNGRKIQYTILRTNVHKSTVQLQIYLQIAYYFPITHSVLLLTYYIYIPVQSCVIVQINLFAFRNALYYPTLMPRYPKPFYCYHTSHHYDITHHITMTSHITSLWHHTPHHYDIMHTSHHITMITMRNVS